MNRYVRRGPAPGVRLATIVRESATYRGLRTLRRWAAGSVTWAVLSDERVLKGLAAAFVTLGVVSVLASNLGAGVKLLSFLLVFAVVGAVTLRRLDPPAE